MNDTSPNIFGREPAFIIGLVASCVVAVVGVLLGNGVLSEAAAGKITDVANALAQILVILTPLIAGIITRQRVTPTANPSLPLGTTVVTPTGASATVAPNA